MSLGYYDFDPRKVPWQWPALKHFTSLDWSLGVHDIGYCGIVGSAKTTLAAWQILDHCCRFRDANAFIGRRSFQDLKETSYTELKDFIENTWGAEAVDSWCMEGTCSIQFPWGSKVTGGTWGDGRYEKYKSKKYSAAWLEEPTENSGEEYNGFLNVFRPRVGRISNNNSDVQENFIIYSFNAHDPEHPIYDEFYVNPVEGLTHLFESKEMNNPFLHDAYYTNLMKRLDPLNIKRQLYNEWTTASVGSIYHAYDPKKNYRDQGYTINKRYPVHISWDFNIGDGKPLSVVMSQYIDDTFHYFDEIIIEGIRTEDSCVEIHNRGYFNHGLTFVLQGDATGASRSTSSRVSDWIIIRDFFNKHPKRPIYKFQVGKSNPAVRSRHNTVNGYMYNGLGEVRLYVYKKCPTLNKGFKLTAFKKNSSIEDDSKYYQHCTTSAGYNICSTIKNHNAPQARSRNR